MSTFAKASLEVKVCGITRLRDARKALSLGANYLGFITYEDSPRFVDRETISTLFSEINRKDFKKVLVDVNPSPEKLKEFESLGFDFFQLHFAHDLDLGRLQEWRDVLGEKLWLAPKLPPETVFPENLLNYSNYFLIDAYAKNKFGGTGLQSDWGMYAKCKESFPDKTWILAGGLNAENVGNAVESIQPQILDFNSGVEIGPGIKDHSKLQKVFEQLTV